MQKSGCQQCSLIFNFFYRRIYKQYEEEKLKLSFNNPLIYLSFFFPFFINNHLIFQQTALVAFSRLKYSLLVCLLFPLLLFCFDPIDVICISVRENMRACVCFSLYNSVSQTFMFRQKQFSMNCVFSCSQRFLFS